MARPLKPRISESDWLNAKNITALDLYRSAFGQTRKWRLFSIACVRRTFAFLNAAPCHHAVESAEDFADGKLDWDEVKQRRKAFFKERAGLFSFGDFHQIENAIHAIEATTMKDPLRSLRAVQYSGFTFCITCRTYK